MSGRQRLVLGAYLLLLGMAIGSDVINSKALLAIVATPFVVLYCAPGRSRR